ncbi:hypothetical protein EAG_09366 [Camponotus floridanus]|uniref:Uncharacterized protein n=1 Tax=Camponotus floridanus TaxID=104421 RepID=E2B0Q5_CAMFO|nr:hypothetical protein EAG_09366 [Camponotus floridanus]
MRTERPRTAGRIAPTGRVTPTVHQTSGGRRKAIPVPPPRVPTPMPVANNNQQNSARSALSARDIPGVAIENGWYLNLAASHRNMITRMLRRRDANSARRLRWQAPLSKESPLEGVFHP